MIYGCVAMVAGYWVRQTSDAAAAYKAYHRAKIEFGLGQASLEDVCSASRRCCIAQCCIPRLSSADVLESHMRRINGIRPPQTGVDTGAESGDRGATRAWKTFHDEAEMWIKLGKPK